MVPCRQKDYATSAAQKQCHESRAVLQAVVSHLKRNRASLLSSNSLISRVIGLYLDYRSDYVHCTTSPNPISTTDLIYNCNASSDVRCLLDFIFRAQHLIRMMKAMGWPSDKTCTRRKRYCVSPILSYCVVFKRLATPAKWTDMELILGKHRFAHC